MMLSLLLAALVGDLIFLPAILSSPIGRFFRFAKRKPVEDIPSPAPGATAQETEAQPAAVSSTGQSHPHVRSDRPHRSSTKPVS
jgi:hypothetical protein